MHKIKKMFKEWGAAATATTALATCLIALGTFYQSLITASTLKVYKEQLRLSQKPLLFLSGSADPNKMADVNFERLGEAGEAWILPFVVTNGGDKPAYGVRYGHHIDNKEDYEMPDEQDLQTGYSENIIMPKMSAQLGQDKIYRQAIIDDQANGKNVYRHLCAIYYDEFGNKHKYLTTLKLRYEVGKQLEWLMITYKETK